MINGVVALLIGLYFILVLAHGRQGQFFKTVSQETGFLKWAGALLMISYIYAQVDSKTGEIIKAFIIIALAAMLLKNGAQMFEQIGKLFEEEKTK